MKPDDGHFAIDQAKAEEDAKFDGVFVLRNQRKAVAPRSDARLQAAIRTSKSLFETRPIYHKLDETIRGHVSCSFQLSVPQPEPDDVGLYGTQGGDDTVLDKVTIDVVDDEAVEDFPFHAYSPRSAGSLRLAPHPCPRRGPEGCLQPGGSGPVNEPGRGAVRHLHCAAARDCTVAESASNARSSIAALRRKRDCRRLSERVISSAACGARIGDSK
jgi:hypothetical protein